MDGKAKVSVTRAIDEAGASGVTRRTFLQTGAAAGLLTALPAAAEGAPADTAGGQAEPGGDARVAGSRCGTRAAGAALLELLRVPDGVTAYANRKDPLRLERAAEEWHGGGGITVGTRVRGKGVQGTSVPGTELGITLAAPRMAVERVHLRWRMRVDAGLLILGDAWERSYGELGWRGIIPERVMPWYFATYTGQACHGYGVKTQAGALCFWQVDPEGVSLWLDVANGGSGVLLGSRVLAAATVVTRKGAAGEDAHAAVTEFCRQMCAGAPLPMGPVYGFNDWYYAYGRNTAQQILADTDLLAQLSDGNRVRPFSVVDDGWQNLKTFPSLPGLAGEIKARGVRPGIWIRPLQAPAGADGKLLLPDARYGARHGRSTDLAYDPTIPEARELVLAKFRQAVGWGYELVKHDFSTYELLGQWGFEMGGEPTQPGWSLADRSRTNAEVIVDLYRGIRASCGGASGAATVILGCNAVGHLGQGVFDLQRTGDDTSGRVWERTRRMGVNTLAFRLPQQGTFFVQDADCVGIAPTVAWEKNSQWLDVLAQSGTAVFVSPGEGARGAEQKGAIQAAFALAAAGGSGARPTGWMEESTPARWISGGEGKGREQLYRWCDPDGAWPFSA